MVLSPLAKMKLAFEPKIAEELHAKATGKSHGHLIKLGKDLLNSRDLLKIGVIILIAGIALSLWVNTLFHAVSIAGLTTVLVKAKHLYDTVEKIHGHAKIDASLFIEMGLHEVTELFGFKIA